MTFPVHAFQRLVVLVLVLCHGLMPPTSLAGGMVACPLPLLVSCLKEPAGGQDDRPQFLYDSSCVSNRQMVIYQRLVPDVLE